METQARYVTIGAFALAGILGILGFLLWFAAVEVDRQFDYYEIDFPNVSGLSTASPVRFNGYPVGQVVSIQLAPERSGLIRVRIEVDAETPVRVSSVATVESQGVTGVGFVALSTGEAEEPLLDEVSQIDPPMILAGRSTIQVLTQDAPEIVEETLYVARQLGELFGEDNQTRISNIFANVDAASEDLSSTLDDFSDLSETIAKAGEDIALFTTRLENIANAATEALGTADVALQNVTELAQRAETTLDNVDAALEAGTLTLTNATGFIENDLPTLTSELTGATQELRQQVNLVVTDARLMIEDFRNTGAIASQRLTEAQVTLQTADTMLLQMTEALGSVDTASQSLNALIVGDGAALVADLRTTTANANTLIANATQVVQEDLPAIVADIRSATETASTAVTQVSTGLTEATGNLDGLMRNADLALTSAIATFASANTTIKNLNTAIESGDQAFVSAEMAFASADEVLREDVGTLVAELTETLNGFDTAIAGVSDDLPEITSQLRATVERANSAIATFQAAVAASSGPVQAFATDGLAQYERLAEETRALVDNLDQLVRNIDRDPARFFLGGDEPVFRR